MRLLRFSLVLVLLTAFAAAAAAAKPVSFAIWSKIELAFPGPSSQGRGTPNPFAVWFDVTFTGPHGQTYRVPGFYDGDGHGGLDGNQWEVRFAADQVGLWTYQTHSSVAKLDGTTGQFTAGPVSPEARGFWKWGRLE